MQAYPQETQRLVYAEKRRSNANDIIEQELKQNAYPGRGIVIGQSANGKYAVTAYFIMGRSENSRNRVFVEDGDGIRTQAFDPSKLSDPSLIIYARYVYSVIKLL